MPRRARSYRRRCLVVAGVAVMGVLATPGVAVAVVTSVATRPAVCRTSCSSTTSVVSVASLADNLAGMRGVNYYPARNSWAGMWTEWNPGQIDADLAKIRRRLGANVVRINLFPLTFGYPVPTEVYRERLERVIAMAHARDLRTMIVLFDWFDAYTDIAGSKA